MLHGRSEKRVEEVLDTLGLADVADRLTATYSGGMVRRLELAKALVSRPPLLVLDEPTIGLTQWPAMDFGRAWKTFASRQG